jgi:DNA (cytosine-5)-methyltransferase 1
MGYSRAGFTEIVGIDNRPQPRYPFTFIQADALKPPVRLEDFDAIHASPPCQAYTQSALAFRNAGKVYPDLVAATRELLVLSGRPWVIENVPGAPVFANFTVCGCQVGLALRRRRLFEMSDAPFEMTPPCKHEGPVVSVVGHGTPSWVREQLGYNPTIHDYRAAMGIDWMNRGELSQAIPPAYTEFIGRQLIAALQ